MHSGGQTSLISGCRGATLIELLIAMSILTLILGAVLVLQLQGTRMYQDVAARDWATFEAATAVERLEEEIAGSFRVVGRYPDRVTISMPLMVRDSESGMDVPAQPLACGDAIRYYLSDASGQLSAGGKYLWRAVRQAGTATFIRDRAPLAGRIERLQFSYDMMPAPREASVKRVHLLVKARVKEGGAVRVRAHSARIMLRNAVYGPITHEPGVDREQE